MRYWLPPPEQALTPELIAVGCIESGARAILLEEASIPVEFFDLSTRFAGELLHRLGIYGIRLGAVVPDTTDCSDAFNDFVREANRGKAYRFFSSRDEAVRWLEGLSEDSV